MKKIFVVIIVLLVIISGYEGEKKFSLLDYFSGDYKVYTTNNTVEDSINLGFCYMSSIPQAGNVVGESLEISNFEVGEALKTLKAKVIKTEYLEGGTTVLYAHTKLINDCVNIGGEEINLQFAIKDERVTIGWPLILGSF